MQGKKKNTPKYIKAGVFENWREDGIDVNIFWIRFNTEKSEHHDTDTKTLTHLSVATTYEISFHKYPGCINNTIRNPNPADFSSELTKFM